MLFFHCFSSSSFTGSHTYAFIHFFFSFRFRFSWYISVLMLVFVKFHSYFYFFLKNKLNRFKWKKNWCNSYATMCCGVYTWAWLNTELVCMLWLIQLYAPNIVLPARSLTCLFVHSFVHPFVRSFVRFRALARSLLSLSLSFSLLLALLYIFASLFVLLSRARTLLIRPLPIFSLSLFLSVSFVQLRLSVVRDKKK